MPSSKQEEPSLEFHPLTANRWCDLASLFEHHGNPGYCWCMTWRLSSGQYKQLDSTGRQKALEALVKTGTPTGILAYFDGQPVGWCSIAPRETYTRLEASTTLKRIDDLPTWSVVCFFVNRSVRGQGLSVKLLQAATAYAISRGARIIEGYPVAPHESYRFMGSPSTFKKVGFQVAATAGNGRQIMRFVVSDNEHRDRKRGRASKSKALPKNNFSEGTRRP
jgi:GNAT superfamily N-acetyltransferase